MDFKRLIQEAHGAAIEKGWWKDECDKRRPLMLVITEIAEAVEADRKNKRADKKQFHNDLGESGDFKLEFETFIKDSLEDELADVCIRLFDYAGQYAVSVDKINFAYAEQTSKEMPSHTLKEYEVAAKQSETEFGLVNSKDITKNFADEIRSGQRIKIKCIPSYLFTTTRTIIEIYHKAFPGKYIGEAIGRLKNICIQLNIDLEWHIEMKMKYNKTRAFKHGNKQY